MRIGVDLGGTKIEFIALGDNGSILARNRIPAPRNRYRETLAAIKDGVEALESTLGERASVGIGIPGTISPYTGLVQGANSTWLIGNPIDRDLEESLGRPIRVANDANCFALSEAIDGSGAKYKVVFGVILGTGVGGGLCINGEALPGRNGIAGEWGHSPMPQEILMSPEETSDVRACYCGKQNCIETFLSGPGFSRSFFDQSEKELTPQKIIQRLSDNDTSAHAVLSTYEKQLACALAGVINIIDPDIIVLGGGMSNIARLYETVPNLWQEWCFSDRIDTLLKPPLHGDSSGVRGAAWLWPIE
jgi:fructokinase